tara:strand:+ start:2609 stop:3097 length:489 start_codon:yes stop_codon:yes gene_type:complete
MAIYHKGVKLVFAETETNGGWDRWAGGDTSDFQVALVDGTGTFEQDQTEAVVADVFAHTENSEVVATGYARKDLGGRELAVGGDMTKFTATDTAFGNVGSASGGTNSEILRAALILQFVGDNDNDYAAICAIDLPGAPITTNGGTITLEWDANGVFALDATP